MTVEGSSNLVGYVAVTVLVLLVVVAVVLAVTALRAGGTTTASIEPPTRSAAPDVTGQGASTHPRDRVQAFLVIAVLFLIAERVLFYVLAWL